MRKNIVILISLFVSTVAFGQESFSFEANTQINISSNESLLPHYQYSNNWGIVDPFEQSQGLLLLGGKYRLINKKNLSLEMGSSVVVKNKTDDSFLHEAYVNAKIFNFIDVSLGKHAFSPVSYNDNLSIGGFMRNANVRPIPRAQIGIFEYQSVGFLNNIVSVRGGLSHGILNDNRTATGKSNSVDHVQVHEKWAYFKLETQLVQPYAGVFHGALMGGERPNGDKLEKDYWATFFGEGSDRLGGGEATNAAGAHDGFFDFGLYHENAIGDFHFYLQKPFADGSGLNVYKHRNHDYKIGLLAEFKKSDFIQKVSFEVFRTDHQSGYGLPDAMHPEGGLIFPREIDDYDAFMNDVFGVTTEGFTFDDFTKYLRDYTNYGCSFGGRDDYNNNGTYYNGWTYQGLPMGLPLYHTYSLAKAYAPDWNANNHGVFVNNRVKGFHIGIEGEVIPGLKYTLKTTYSNNLGSYAEEFVKRYSWEKDEENLYSGGKKEVYSDLSFLYRTHKWKNILLHTSFSYDAGDLYHAFGCMFGISYCIN